jgi:hypothetical protein
MSRLMLALLQGIRYIDKKSFFNDNPEEFRNVKNDEFDVRSFN